MELFASRVHFTSPIVMILYIIDIPTVTVMAKKEMKSLRRTEMQDIMQSRSLARIWLKQQMYFARGRLQIRAACSVPFDFVV